MSTFALWRLFHRPGSRGSAGHTSMLAIIAFAAATTIFLTVLGGPTDDAKKPSDHGEEDGGWGVEGGECQPASVAG